MFEAMEELEMDIAEMEPCADREELERTRDFCQDMIHLCTEGYVYAETGEDGELRFFPA